MGTRLAAVDQALARHYRRVEELEAERAALGPAVYFLLRGDAVAYVGMSRANAPARLRSHQQDRGHLFDATCIVKAQSPEHAAWLEAWLIAHLDPPLNACQPQGLTRPWMREIRCGACKGARCVVRVVDGRFCCGGCWNDHEPFWLDTNVPPGAREALRAAAKAATSDPVAYRKFLVRHGLPRVV